MKFTIIIPTLNAGAKLHITLDSLAKQTYQDFECIIMDGNSLDNTAEIANTYQNKIPALQFYSEADNGIYDAMNKAVTLSSGEYVLFLGAGDSLYNDNVLEHVNMQLNTVSCDILYGDICFLPSKIAKQPQKINKRYFRSGKMLCHQSIFAKKETLIDYPFHTIFTYGADRDWLIHNYHSNKHFSHIPLIIANYDTTGYTGKAENQKAVWMESGKILKQYYGSIMIPVTFIKYYLIIKWRLLWQSSKQSAEK